MQSFSLPSTLWASSVFYLPDLTLGKNRAICFKTLRTWEQTVKMGFSPTSGYKGFCEDMED